MSNVTFDSEAELTRTSAVQRSTASITAWLISKKFAKDENQANYILLGILAICILITGFALANLFSSGSNIDAEERMRLEQSTSMPR